MKSTRPLQVGRTFRLANAYYRSALQLGESVGGFSAPIRFLLDHAVELYLKAFLTDVGVPSDNLHIHSLKTLATKAKDYGLNVVVPSVWVGPPGKQEELTVSELWRYQEFGNLTNVLSVPDQIRITEDVRRAVGQRLMAAGRIISRNLA
jgi:hypothetical protein